MSEIIRIQPSHPSQGAWVEIEAGDFDPARHTRHTPPPAGERPDGHKHPDGHKGEGEGKGERAAPLPAGKKRKPAAAE